MHQHTGSDLVGLISNGHKDGSRCVRILFDQVGRPSFLKKLFDVVERTVSATGLKLSGMTGFLNEAQGWNEDSIMDLFIRLRA